MKGNGEAGADCYVKNDTKNSRENFEMLMQNMFEMNMADSIGMDKVNYKVLKSHK